MSNKFVELLEELEREGQELGIGEIPPWGPVCSDMPNHPKTLKFKRLLGESLGRSPSLCHNEAVGMLVSIWKWCEIFCLNGCLEEVEPIVLAEIAHFDHNGFDLIEMLKDAGFAEVRDDGKVWLHDWEDYAGGLIESQEKKEVRKQQNKEAKVRSRMLTNSDVSKKSADVSKKAADGSTEVADGSTEVADGATDYTRLENTRKNHTKSENTKLENNPLSIVRVLTHTHEEEVDFVFNCFAEWIKPEEADRMRDRFSRMILNYPNTDHIEMAQQCSRWQKNNPESFIGKKGAKKGKPVDADMVARYGNWIKEEPKSTSATAAPTARASSLGVPRKTDKAPTFTKTKIAMWDDMIPFLYARSKRRTALDEFQNVVMKARPVASEDDKLHVEAENKSHLAKLEKLVSEFRLALRSADYEETDVVFEIATKKREKA